MHNAQYINDVQAGLRPLDERDQKILDRRRDQLDEITGPRVGDWVRFNDGTMRRISHLWPEDAQTSAGGSFYLGEGHVSMSGSLYRGVPIDDLKLTDEIKGGSVWFFHHDYHTAHNGVTVQIPFRVYTYDGPPTS